jgi:ABC-type Zn2+ transport system substrate-binding protein/surface adhesin
VGSGREGEGDDEDGEDDDFDDGDDDDDEDEDEEDEDGDDDDDEADARPRPSRWQNRVVIGVHVTSVSINAFLALARGCIAHQQQQQQQHHEIHIWLQFGIAVKLPFCFAPPSNFRPDDKESAMKLTELRSSP